MSLVVNYRADSVTQPDELIVNILSSTLCSPTDIAKVEVEADGGIMPYQFLYNRCNKFDLRG